MSTDKRSTLERGEEIERDFYRLKAMEIGPRSDGAEVKMTVECVLELLWRLKA